MPTQTENLNVLAFDHMPSPEEIKARVPFTERAAASVVAGRKAVMDILDRKDPRVFVVVGPCSICRFQKTAALNVRSRLHYSSGGVGSIRQRRAAAGQKQPLATQSG